MARTKTIQDYENMLAEVEKNRKEIKKAIRIARNKQRADERRAEQEKEDNEFLTMCRWFKKNDPLYLMDVRKHYTEGCQKEQKMKEMQQKLEQYDCIRNIRRSNSFEG